MIGVCCAEAERPAVREFFELFKTPWEFYRPGEIYQVAISTAPDFAPATDLVIVCGTAAANLDGQFCPHQSRENGVSIVFQGDRIPLLNAALLFERSEAQVVCSAGEDIAGVSFRVGETKVVRLGYSLFAEVASLLTGGQTVEHATAPTLELHIAMLRELMLEAGVPVVEVAPSPYGHDFSVCLTHDIDFVGIRRHFLDHTMWGFLLRATAGALVRFVQGSLSFGRLLQSWKAALLLPFVYAGLARDFWMCFDWFLRIERGLKPTYFFIPFRKRAGDRVNAPNGRRRACAYDITDIPELASRLQRDGCELGVHGIDAWHDISKSREEYKRVETVSGAPAMGIRMHWLLRDDNTYRVLDEAGYDYDSTAGYNETPGYRCGTTQVFKPLTARQLLELPMHIQDGALFYTKRMGLRESEAWELCTQFIANARRFGGVLTLLWHDRSPGPERFWGEFYARLVDHLKTLRVWFAHGSEVVAWFRRRREVKFESVHPSDGTVTAKLSGGERVFPPFKVRIYWPAQQGAGTDDQKSGFQIREVSWDGAADLRVDRQPERSLRMQSDLLILSTANNS